MRIGKFETVCSIIIDNLTTIAVDLCDDEDREKGYYFALNRTVQKERFTLHSIAIFIVSTDQAITHHSGKISQITTELRIVAKKSGKSCHDRDKRKM